jgi:hypothetical protein
MAAEFRVFLSAVTSEFGTARDAVANDLQALDLQLRVQRSFRQEPVFAANSLELYGAMQAARYQHFRRRHGRLALISSLSKKGETAAASGSL